MDDRIVAIHQPNFFPWLGYFDKITRSDAFVFLDEVQIPKKGGTWSNRVKLLVSGKARWVTAALDRDYSGVRNINEAHFKANEPWRENVLKTIKFNYGSAPHFDEIYNFIAPLINYSESNIAEYNIHAILTITDKLGIPESKFHKQSELSYKGEANELLFSLTHNLDGDIYMCGGGADDYQDDELFAEFGIKLKYQDFDHPKYRQKGTDEFVEGLSIIDPLMNLGIESTARLLNIR